LIFVGFIDLRPKRERLNQLINHIVVLVYECKDQKIIPIFVLLLGGYAFLVHFLDKFYNIIFSSKKKDFFVFGVVGQRPTFPEQVADHLEMLLLVCVIHWRFIEVVYDR